MKKRSARRKHCALAVGRRNQKVRPAADPLPGGAGRPKFNQLEMVTIFTYKPSWWGSMHTISNYRGNRPTHTQTNTQTKPQTWPITIHCAAKPNAQCKYLLTIKSSDCKSRLGNWQTSRACTSIWIHFNFGNYSRTSSEAMRPIFPKIAFAAR